MNGQNPGGFGLSTLRQGQAQRQKAKTVDVRLFHPNEAAITQICEDLAKGSTEDVAGAASKIRDLLTQDGIYVRVAASRREDDGTGTLVDRPLIVNGQRVANFGSFSVWAAKPSSEDSEDGDNRGKMIYRSWGQQGRRGFVQRFVDFVNETLRKAVAPKTPAGGKTTEIPEGHASAPAASGGEQQVELEQEG